MKINLAKLETVILAMNSIGSFFFAPKLAEILRSIKKTKETPCYLHVCMCCNMQFLHSSLKVLRSFYFGGGTEQKKSRTIKIRVERRKKAVFLP